MHDTEIRDNIAQDIYEIYRKVKLYTFHRIFRKITTKEEDSLTALEVLSLDLIQGMEDPTQTEFARYINVSMPNATYKLNSLEKKGYLTKEQSAEDGRIYYLRVTEKTKELLGTSERYSDILCKRLQREFKPEELKVFEKVIHAVSKDLMSELDRYVEYNI
ncbi:MAG: MarR family transcriptional regulator [Clostridiaceae bacterium]|nr:MarR family transcriptional regulator [Clostridiaceae bacterium]